MKFSFSYATLATMLITIVACCPMNHSDHTAKRMIRLNQAFLKKDVSSYDSESPGAPRTDSSQAFNKDDDNDGTSLLPSANLLTGKPMYVDPFFQKKISKTMEAATGAVKHNLSIMQRTATAFWLDSNSRVLVGKNSADVTAERTLENAASMSPAPLVTFIVYNLPNRDW